jgi:hypothetical protein
MMDLRRPFAVAALALLQPLAAAGIDGMGLEQLEGTWEGSLSYAMRTPTPEASSDSTAYDVRLRITRSTLVQFEVRAKGDVEWSPRPRLLRRLRFRKQPAMLEGTYLLSGRDEDGVWVEHQSLVLTVRDADTLLLHNLRVVNNVNLPRDHKNSAWSVLLVGALKHSR